MILIFLVECVRFGVVTRKKKSNASEGVYQQQDLTPFKQNRVVFRLLFFLSFLFLSGVQITRMGFREYRQIWLFVFLFFSPLEMRFMMRVYERERTVYAWCYDVLPPPPLFFPLLSLSIHI